MEAQHNQRSVKSVRSVNYTCCSCQCKKCKNPLGFYTTTLQRALGHAGLGSNAGCVSVQSRNNVALKRNAHWRRAFKTLSKKFKESLSEGCRARTQEPHSVFQIHHLTSNLLYGKLYAH